MPLLLRLGQCTLKGSLGGPRSLCRADRSMESSRRIHRVVWNKSPIQLMPAILMEGPDCRIDASGATESTATTASSFLGCPWGPIGLVGPIGAVESNGISTELYGRIFQYNCCRNACRRRRLLLLLQLLRVLCLHSRFESMLWALEVDPILHRIDLL